MLSYNHSYDGGTFEESEWPSYYPDYFSPQGWELQKLDAQIDICNQLFKGAKTATAMSKYLLIKIDAEIKRNEIIGKNIFNN